MAELRLLAPVIVIVAVWWYRDDIGGRRERGSDVHRRGWEAVERWAKAGRMRRVTALDGVGQPMDGRLVGAPEVRGLSLLVKEEPGGKQRVPSLSPCSSPLRRLCLSPFGGVQSSRASRATRTLLSDILGSLENHPKIPEVTKQLLSL